MHTFPQYFNFIYRTSFLILPLLNTLCLGKVVFIIRPPQFLHKIYLWLRSMVLIFFILKTQVFVSTRGKYDFLINWVRSKQLTMFCWLF